MVRCAIAWPLWTGFLEHSNSWNPNAGSTVRAMVLNTTNVYIGGEFTDMGGQPRNRIGSVDSITGQVTSWNPNASDWVYAMVFSAGHLYVGGYFATMSSQSRSGAASFDLSNGSLDNWNPALNGIVFAMDDVS